MGMSWNLLISFILENNPLFWSCWWLFDINYGNIDFWWFEGLTRGWLASGDMRLILFMLDIAGDFMLWITYKHYKTILLVSKIWDSRVHSYIRCLRLSIIINATYWRFPSVLNTNEIIICWRRCTSNATIITRIVNRSHTWINYHLSIPWLYFKSDYIWFTINKNVW